MRNGSVRRLVVPVLGLACASHAGAATLHVPGEMPTIAAALSAAQVGDEIVLACGTYHEHELGLVGGVTIRSETGSPDCATIDGRSAGSVLLASLVTPTAVVEGVAIVNGRANYGAGARLEYSDVAFRRCTISANEVRYDGAAILVTGGSLQLESSLVHHNHDYDSHTWGTTGAIVISAANVRIARSTIAGNTFAPSEWHNDGGIRAAGSTIDIDHSIIARNDGAQVGRAWCTWTESCAVYEDPLFCDLDGGDLRLDSVSPCLPGGICPQLIGGLGHGCGPVVPLSYTVTTDPPGLPLVVDGEPAVGPVTRVWDQYSEHEVSAMPTVVTAPGTRAVLLEWSDGGDASHVLVAPRTSDTFTARYGTQHQLSIPSTAGGTVSPETGWHPAGSVVTITASPMYGRFLTGWDGSGPGSYSGPANPAVVTMLGPVTQTARFDLIPFEFSLSASPTDPHANRADPVDGDRLVYLWLTCARNGLSAMEAGVTGTMQVQDFQALNGVLNAGTPRELLLAVPDCPVGDEVDVLLGMFTTSEPPGGGWMCLGSSGDLRFALLSTVGAVDCHTTHPFYSRAPGVTGFTSDGSTPCRKGRDTCAPVSPAGADFALPAAKEGTAAWIVPRAAPNPFSGAVDVVFSLPRDGRAAVRVYDVGGRLVRVVLDEPRSAGAHRVTWDGRNAEGREVPAGIYFARIRTGDTVHSLKILRVAR